MAAGKHSAPEERYTYDEGDSFDYQEETAPDEAFSDAADYDGAAPEDYAEGETGAYGYDGGYGDDYDEYEDEYEDAGEKKGFFASLLSLLRREKHDDEDDYAPEDEYTPEDGADYAGDGAYGYAGDEAIGSAYEPAQEKFSPESYETGYPDAYPPEDVPADNGDAYYDDGSAYDAQVYDGDYQDIPREEAYPEDETDQEGPYRENEVFDEYGNPLYGDGQDGYEDYYGDERAPSRVPYIVAGVAAAVAVLAILFALLTLLGGKGKSEKTAEQETAAVTPEVIMPQEASAELPASTPEAAGSIALLENGILVPGEQGSVVPQRDTPRTLESFAGTTMIGNSFVEGMQLWSDIEKLEYVCADGVSLDNMIGNYLYFVTVRPYSSIYLTLGLNEIGWPVDSFISKYEKVIDYIRSDAYSPNATIYITSVFPVEEIMETTAAESGSTISLSTIQTFNERLKDMCQRKGCWYLDVYSALANERGYLPSDVAADDHVHFEKTGYRIWTDYLLNHYVDESLVEG